MKNKLFFIVNEVDALSFKSNNLKLKISIYVGFYQKRKRNEN